MESQRRQEKEDFFRGLYGLDDLSDSEKDPLTRSRDEPPQLSPRSRSLRQDRTRVSAAPPTRPVLRRATTIVEGATASSASASATTSTSEAQKGLKRAMSDISPPAKRGNRKTSKRNLDPSFLLEKQFFNGSRFLFIPNRGLTALRKKQIAGAALHGAEVVTIFDNNITHIIADSKWELEHVLNELPNGRRPQDIPMITEHWLVECIVNQALQNYDQLRFFVKGTKSAVVINPRRDTDFDDKGLPSIGPGSESVVMSSGGLTGNSAEVAAQDSIVCLNEEAIPSLTPDPVFDKPFSEGDELDTLQKEMKDNSMNLVEDMVKNDPSFKFEGDYVFDTLNTSSAGSNFSCANKNELGHVADNPNCITIHFLQEMARIYDLNRSDQFRARAFKTAATTLSRQRVLIATKEDAAKLPRIGTSIAEKIEEIVRNGRLSRLDGATSDPRYRTLNLFMGIYQVGHAQASAWAAAGYSSLEQLLEHGDLTSNQRIGIEHYQDFQTRIPRAEVIQHGLVVEKELKAIDPDLLMIIGGSYRRGSSDSGDIDILITKRYAKLEQIRTAIVASLIPSLKKQGFIVAELACGYSSNKNNSSKWMGACLLPSCKIWRRLDLLFVPWDELGAALIYWTGNDFFNRSLRLFASRKDMRLNQHGLYKNVLRGKGRIKLSDGELIESHSEKKIFEHLGIAYRPPEHRNP